MTIWSIDILPLIEQLAQEKPVSMGLIIGEGFQPDTWPGEWLSIALLELEHLPFTQRYDLAVIGMHPDYYGDKHIASNPDPSINQADNDIERQKTISLTRGLTRLRDLLARRVLVLAHPHYTDLLYAMGFSQIEQLEQQLYLWQFNILSYKHVPDWLNSKYWANPENWGKYRW